MSSVSTTNISGTANRADPTASRSARNDRVLQRNHKRGLGPSSYPAEKLLIPLFQKIDLGTALDCYERSTPSQRSVILRDSSIDEPFFGLKMLAPMTPPTLENGLKSTVVVHCPLSANPARCPWCRNPCANERATSVIYATKLVRSVD
jgi:hypothetical protein